MRGFFTMGDCGVGGVLVLELYRVAEAFAACQFDVTFVHAIMLGRRGNVPSVKKMKRPGASLVGLLVDLDLATQQCQ